MVEDETRVGVMISLSELKKLVCSEKYRFLKEKVEYALQTLEYSQSRELVSIKEVENVLLEEASDDLYVGMRWTHLLKKLIDENHDLLFLIRSENKILVEFVKEIVSKSEGE